MEKNILILGNNLGNIESKKTQDEDSILGADILIINTLIHNKINIENIFDFLNPSRQEEVNELLKEGKNIFILMGSTTSKPKSTKTISLKNKKEDHLFIENNIDECLFDFFSKGEGYGFFNTIYTKDNVKNVLLKSKIGNNIYSWYQKQGKSHIVFLPQIVINKDFPYSIGENAKKFKEKIIKIDNFLCSQSEQIKKPDWFNEKDYMFNKEFENKNKISKNTEKIKDLKDENKNLAKDIKDLEEYKLLLYGTGIPLEKAVIKALKTLGLEAENKEIGLQEIDQIITASNDKRYVGETEGTNNCIKTKKLRQLTDKVGADIEEQEKKDKTIYATGILFGNAFKNKKPSEISEECFSPHAKNHAERFKEILFSTKELFKAVKYSIENPKENYPKYFNTELDNFIGKEFKFTPPKK
ncbi:MAG: hypothetical protein N4A44_02820 [Alphaproteobacteria bacterium]|jgi:hypothetical protein|nr:hypothetical protein [Alphaproteobacteria bacterium]